MKKKYIVIIIAILITTLIIFVSPKFTQKKEDKEKSINTKIEVQKEKEETIKIIEPEVENNYDNVYEMIKELYSVENVNIIPSIKEDGNYAYDFQRKSDNFIYKTVTYDIKSGQISEETFLVDRPQREFSKK